MRIFSAVFLIGALFLFTSAFFPNWQVRWGRGDKGPHVSVAGRIAFGVLMAYFFVLTLVGVYGPLGMAIYILLLAVVGMVMYRDGRNRKI